MIWNYTIKTKFIKKYLLRNQRHSQLMNLNYIFIVLKHYINKKLGRNTMMKCLYRWKQIFSSSTFWEYEMWKVFQRWEKVQEVFITRTLNGVAKCLALIDLEEFQMCRNQRKNLMVFGWKIGKWYYRREQRLVRDDSQIIMLWTNNIISGNKIMWLVAGVHLCLCRVKNVLKRLQSQELWSIYRELW